MNLALLHSKTPVALPSAGYYSKPERDHKGERGHR